MSENHIISRRELLKQGSAVAAGMALFPSDTLAKMFQLGEGERLVEWLDADEQAPIPGMNLLNWNDVDSWITPVDRFFKANHYNVPDIDGSTYELEITGAVRQSLELTIDEIRRRPQQSVDFALECSGNRGFSWFKGGVYNATWTGTPLASILEDAGILRSGMEVVFFGHDEGEEEIQPLRGKKLTMKQNFARNLDVKQAMDPSILLCYEVNGQPIPKDHGFPIRLITPGWYGIQNVKWLKRIEVRTTRFMGRFISRDYVTIREELQDGETVFTQTSVGKGRINSTPAKVTRIGDTYKIYGAAWGAPIGNVQVRVGDTGWQTAEIIEGADSEYGWKFWRLEVNNPARGEYDVISRAISPNGSVQPTPNDPYLTRKHTYWESNGQVTRRFRV